MNQELKLMLSEAAKTAGKSQSNRSAYAEVITELVRPNQISYDVFDLFLPTRQLKVGDILEKRLQGVNLPVYTMVPGTNHLAAVPRPPKSVMTYALDRIITKVRQNLIEVQRGEIATADEIRRQMTQSLINEIVARCWTLIGTVWNGSTYYTNYVDATSSFTETVLERMVETVARTAGSVRGIYGTQAVLQRVYKFAGVTERTATGSTTPTLIPLNPLLEEWARTGRVASFRGIPIVEIPQVFEQSADGYEKPLIKEDRIYVIGDNAGEIVLYGDVETQEHVDYSVEPAEWVIAMWRQFGLIVDRADRIGYIRVAEPTFHYRILP